MEIEEIDPESECCGNCRFWDARTQFCRLNPPQVVIQYVNGMGYPQAAWPKVSMPHLDWCSYFERTEPDG